MTSTHTTKSGFLAVNCENSHWLEQLSPRRMLWESHVWLIDLQPVKSYWALQLGITPWKLSIFLERLPSPADCYIAGAYDPATALMLLHEMRSRKLVGNLAIDGIFGTKIFIDSRWSTLWHLADCLGRVWQHIRPKGFTLSSYLRKLAHFQAMQNPLGLKKPILLSQRPPASLMARMDPFLSSLVCWIYHPSQPTRCDFPWIPWEPQIYPSVQRILDFTVESWDVLQPWLIEDVDHLAKDPFWHGSYGLVAWTWFLFLKDGQEIRLAGRFRHTYHLHDGRGHHETYIFQMKQSFFQDIPNLKMISEGIIGWKIQVDEISQETRVNLDLFGLQENIDILQNIENQCTVPLHRACVIHHGFITSNQSHDNQKKCLKAMVPSILALYQHRPLFRLRIPRPIMATEFSIIRPLEAMTIPFWDKDEESLHTSYYLGVDRQDRLLWLKKVRSQWILVGYFS